MTTNAVSYPYKTVENNEDLELMFRQAKCLVQSNYLPESVKEPQQAIAIMMMGRELNIPPWQAIIGINIVKGKPTVSPQLMIALIERSGKLEDIVIEQGKNECSVTMKRVGRTPHKETFSMENAKRMGLSGKHNWKAQPETMLKWRAVSACARVVFPDVICGLYTPEELNPDLQVNELGENTPVSIKYQNYQTVTGGTVSQENIIVSSEKIEEPKPEQEQEPVNRTKSEPEAPTRTKPEPEPEKWTEQQRKLVFASLSEKRPSKTEEEKKGYLRQLAKVESCNEILKSQVDFILEKINKLPPEQPKIVRSEMRTTNVSKPKTNLKKLEEERETFLLMGDGDKLNPYQMDLIYRCSVECGNKELTEYLSKKVDNGERITLGLWKKLLKKHTIDLSPKK